MAKRILAAMAGIGILIGPGLLFRQSDLGAGLEQERAQTSGAD
ncbi:MAG: hypothetical protein V8Q27_07355 [Eubacteriales bacterium]